jgi:C_GCAxxG_C_C family probable redox protein
MKKTDKAIEYFRNKFNCSQSVFTVFGTDYGLSEDECLKVACAFGGGMGRQQYTCGAVTGALMVLGLKYGKSLNDDEDKKELTYSKTRELFAKFNKIHGTTNCRELLNGLDLNNPEDHKKIVEQRLFDTKCKKCVFDSVIIVENLMK